jgi:hypothetical protein
MSKARWAVAFVWFVAGCSESTGPSTGKHDAAPSDSRDLGGVSATGGSTSVAGAGGAATGGSGATVGSGGAGGADATVGADAAPTGKDSSVGVADTNSVGDTQGRGDTSGRSDALGSSDAGRSDSLGSSDTGRRDTSGTGGVIPGTGGTGGGTGGAVGTGGSKGTGGSTTCFAAPAQQIGTQASGGSVSDYGTVRIWAKSPHQIVRLQTRMVVPPPPPASGTLFLWPGLQPDGVNFQPIDNGVLQPVLTWGPSCAPGKQPRTYSTWWISGQYVNTNGQVSGYTGCAGGTIMSVNVCDTLDIDMVLSGTTWIQTITDEQTNQTVSYSIDMKNQAQNLAYFVIEEYSSTPVSEVIFTDTVITFDTSDAADCKVSLRGQTDFVSSPTASTDGLQCSIPQIILRAKGIQ